MLYSVTLRREEPDDIDINFALHCIPLENGVARDWCTGGGEFVSVAL
jgi:NADPH-dependent ferric siderophore reductase